MDRVSSIKRVVIAPETSPDFRTLDSGKTGGLDYAAWHARLRSANTPFVGPVAEPRFLPVAEQAREAPRRVA